MFQFWGKILGIAMFFACGQKTAPKGSQTNPHLSETNSSESFSIIRKSSVGVLDPPTPYLGKLTSNGTCTVALIGPRLAVTAAHCVVGVELASMKLNIPAFNSEGSGNIKANPRILEVIPNPNYSEENPHLDLAFILLKKCGFKYELYPRIYPGEIPADSTIFGEGFGDYDVAGNFDNHARRGEDTYQPSWEGYESETSESQVST